MTTNDVSRIEDGQAQYSVLATPAGTVVDDLLIYRRTPENFMLVVNAANVRKTSIGRGNTTISTPA